MCPELIEGKEGFVSVQANANGAASTAKAVAIIDIVGTARYGTTDLWLKTNTGDVPFAATKPGSRSLLYE